MVCYRRCRGVRITQLPQEVGIPVLPHGVRVPQAIALPTLAGALLALALALLALAAAWLPVAVPVRVPARAVRFRL